MNEVSLSYLATKNIKPGLP